MSQIDELTQRINSLEKDNKNLLSQLEESSKVYDEQLGNISVEKQRFEDLKKEISTKSVEDKKQKEDVNSKLTNYKTRIFFLESQVEELENKCQSQIDMATTKLKTKNKQLEKDFKKLQKAKDSAESKLGGLRDKLEEIIEDEQKFKRKDKESQGKIALLEGTIERLEKNLVEVKTELADKMYMYEMK